MFESYLVYITLIIIKAFQLYYGHQIYCKMYILAENQFIYLENIDYKLKLKVANYIFCKIQKDVFPLMLNMSSNENKEIKVIKKHESSVFKTIDEERDFLTSLLD